MLRTSKEVAELLQVSRSWVYESAQKDRTSHVRLGRYVRFEQDELDRWLTEIRIDARAYHRRRVTPRRASH